MTEEESDDDEDSDAGMDFENRDEAELAYNEYEAACAEWDNTELPEGADEAYEVFLGNSRRWNRFRRVGRPRRDPGFPGCGSNSAIYQEIHISLSQNRMF